MKCVRPYFHRGQGLLFPCGSCWFCRQKKRYRWVARLIMEQQVSNSSVFLTLTFDDEHLPNPPYVNKRDLQLFFKRLRKIISPRKIRYYACAEYGEERGRPHYHAIVYGLNFSDKQAVDDAWKQGFTSLDKVELGSVAYVAGYVSKKFVHSREFQVTGEVKDKEFALMSRRPALGSGFIEKLLPIAFSQNPYDVISTITIGKQNFPLDRTIREKMRSLLMSDEMREKVSGFRKQIYAEQLAEFFSEQLGSYWADKFLEYFKDLEPTSTLARVAEKIAYSAHKKTLPALQDLEKHALRRHRRNKI